MVLPGAGHGALTQGRAPPAPWDHAACRGAGGRLRGGMQPHNRVLGGQVAACLASAGRLAPARHIHVWVLTEVASPARACRGLPAPTATTTPAGALLLLPASRRLRLGTGHAIRACPWHGSSVASHIGAACPQLPRIDLGRGTSMAAAASWLRRMGMRSCGAAHGTLMAVTVS